MGDTARIDLQHLDKYVAGDRALRDEILAIFEEQADLWTRMLDPRGEDSAWKDAAHALKGAAPGTLGRFARMRKNWWGMTEVLLRVLKFLTN